MEAFEGEIRYQLRDKEPTTLRDAQQCAIRIDKNMQYARKSNFQVSQEELLANPLRRRLGKWKIKGLLVMV
jgi:hypothetical protein